MESVGLRLIQLNVGGSPAAEGRRPSAGGIAISETVPVTATGHEFLTRFPRQVFQA